MAHLLLAWELGGGYGHLEKLFAIGKRLQADGHRLTYAVRDVARAGRGAADAGLRLLPAPYKADGPGPPSANYADVLLRCGYRNPDDLAGLLRGWLHLFDLARPDLLLVDHAPTALLAARCAGLPAAATGTGFVLPPPRSPTPSIQPWKPAAAEALNAADAACLDSIRAAGAKFGHGGLDSLGQLFDGNAPLLSTFAEMDHYGQRPQTRYFGPVFANRGDAFPAWEEAEGPKVFAYLSADFAACKPLLAQMRQGPYAMLTYLRDMPARPQEPARDNRLFLAPRPLDMARVLRHADLVICHGGHGTCAAALLAGVPLLVLPQYIEQAFLGHRLADQKLAVVLGDRAKRMRWPDLVAQLLGSPAVGEPVRAFADKYRDFSVEQAVDAVAAQVGALLRDD